jgi:hypothetical protein
VKQLAISSHLLDVQSSEGESSFGFGPFFFDDMLSFKEHILGFIKSMQHLLIDDELVPVIQLLATKHLEE